MNKKILIIDDDLPILELYEIWLTSWGYDVISASGGKEALGLVKNGSYDLVICDAKMPEVSGMEVRKRVSERSPKIPFILASGFGSDDKELKDILSMNISQHIQKPIDFTVLKKEIERLISHNNIARFAQKIT